MTTHYNSKKAFATMQVFVFASALIIMALVLYFGVQGVGIITNRSCDISLADFSDTFESTVEKLSHDFSSITRIELLLPCSATSICIADGSFDGTSVQDISLILQDESVIASRAYEQSVANVFVIEDTRVIHQLNVPEVVVRDDSGSPSAFCLSQSPATLRLEGIARKTLVSPWVSSQ